MTKTAHACLVALGLGLFPLTSAAAEIEVFERVVVADCGDGGCTCMDAAIGPDEAALVTDTDRPEGATLLVRFDDDYIWSPLSPREADILMGGDGQCPIEPIKPRNGTWATQHTIDYVACGEGSALLRSTLLQSPENPVRIDWKGAFDGPLWQAAWTSANPDAERSAMRWTQLAPDAWGATAQEEGASVNFTMQLVHPQQFHTVTTVQGRTEGGSCGWQMSAVSRWVGD